MNSRRNSRDRTRTGRSRPARYPSQAVCRNNATGHDAVEVRMMVEVLAPGVQHGRDADLGAEVLRIGGDRQEALGGGLEQEAVDRRLVLIGDGTDLSRQREDDVEVGDWQQLCLTG